MALKKKGPHTGGRKAEEKSTAHIKHTRSRAPDKNDAILIIASAILANILSLVAVKGPWNMSFSLAAIPILIAAVTRGWKAGGLSGLLGGIMQANEYGSFWYVFYTMIIGIAAGYAAERPPMLRIFAALIAAFGGFFMFWFSDVASTGGKLPETLLQALSITPYRAIMAFIIFAIAVHLLVRSIGLKRHSFLTIMLAGFTGAAAYVPYDMLIMLAVQGYHIAPALLLLSKDLVQDFLAAAVCGLLLQNTFLREKLGIH
ncbi:MAG: hypothetical protein PHG85_03740 [Candidatus Altiarchaeota archaeon]|nr:hypothetical protein [Candidatus Altiarchaeota archaeon]